MCSYRAGWNGSNRSNPKSPCDKISHNNYYNMVQKEITMDELFT